MQRGAVLGASTAEFDLGAHGGEKVARGLNVAHLRNVFEDDWFFGEQGGGHAGQRSIFCAADADRAEQRLAAADYEFVHESGSPKGKAYSSGEVGWGRVIGRARPSGMSPLWRRILPLD